MHDLRIELRDPGIILVNFWAPSEARDDCEVNKQDDLKPWSVLHTMLGLGNLGRAWNNGNRYGVPSTLDTWITTVCQASLARAGYL